MGWGLIEMTGGFFVVGVVTILISGMTGSESMDAFVKGLEIMIIPALVVGFARGIQVVMVEGQILDTMPLMVPLSDLLQISRQTTVLTFTLGDGLSNMIIPTNGVLMAMLGLAGIPYEKWVRFVFPLFLVLCIIALVILGVAVVSGY